MRFFANESEQPVEYAQKYISICKSISAQVVPLNAGSVFKRFIILYLIMNKKNFG